MAKNGSGRRTTMGSTKRSSPKRPAGKRLIG